MDFDLTRAIAVLERTPSVLHAMLIGLDISCGRPTVAHIAAIPGATDPSSVCPTDPTPVPPLRNGWQILHDANSDSPAPRVDFACPRSTYHQEQFNSH